MTGIPAIFLRYLQKFTVTSRKKRSDVDELLTHYRITNSHCFKNGMPGNIYGIDIQIANSGYDGGAGCFEKYLR